MLGTQDVKANGLEWAKAELARWNEDINQEPRYMNVLKIAIAELEAEAQRATEQNQRIAEVDGMALPFDFDADFGVEGVNNIVRQMLKEERANNFAEFNAEYDRLNSECEEKLNGAFEREIQLQRQNEELQKVIEQRAELHDILSKKNSEQHVYILKLEDDLMNANNRNAEVEQNRKNAADQLEEARTEIDRLEHHVDDLRNQINIGERQAQRIIDVSPSVNELYEQAKQATAEKRKVMVTDTIGANFRAIVDADGHKEVVHRTELEGMEQVDSFLEPPDLPDIAGALDSGVQENEGATEVAGSTMVLSASEGIGHSDAGEVEPEALEAQTETTEETVSKEVGETWEQSIERRVAELEAWKNNEYPIAS